MISFEVICIIVIGVVAVCILWAGVLFYLTYLNAVNFENLEALSCEITESELESTLEDD